MIAAGDDRIVSRDAGGDYRFHADFRNVGDWMPGSTPCQNSTVTTSRFRASHCATFMNRSSGTASSPAGRSMFGFEGLGCIYWHMVSKLLLAVQENFFAALEADAGADICQKLGSLYYRVREALLQQDSGRVWCLPDDPYSHTPVTAGHSSRHDRSGQGKVLSRFGELGLRVAGGAVRFDPRLLRAREFRPHLASSASGRERWCRS